MARYIQQKCKVCRRMGAKLFLKGEKCLTVTKCVFEKRRFPPGERPKRIMPKISAYSLQLKEKQKLKHIYGLLERQFKNYFKLALKKKGDTGSLLIELLERRFDNVIYRLNFASSRTQARLLITHGHFLVNGKKVNIPSYLVKKNDKISVALNSRKVYPILKSMAALETAVIPSWLAIEPENFTATVIDLPKRDQIDIPVQESKIVELYSK